MASDFQVVGQMNDSSDRLNTRESLKRKPRYNNMVHLWEFLLELLACKDKCGSMIAWVREKHGEFILKNPDEVAHVWGAFKNITGMNYEKLSRAMRFYYKKGIIKKVPNQRLVYKFDKLPYKYKPGITRSFFDGRRINACIQQHQARVQFAHSYVNNSTLCLVPPVCTPARKKSWSWPLQPMPTRPVMWCPCRAPHPQSTSYSFPGAVHPMIRLPSSFDLNPFRAHLSSENGVLSQTNP